MTVIKFLINATNLDISILLNSVFYKYFICQLIIFVNEKRNVTVLFL